MPQISNKLLAVYVDGETKTGKGAAGAAIANALRRQNIVVYYDVAGDFYRRYVAMVRRDLGLEDSDDLPTGPDLEAAASKLYQSGQAFSLDEDLGDLQRPAISESVAILSELSVVQTAGSDWFGRSVGQAAKKGADVILLDGRNPRRRVAEHLPYPSVDVQVALDLYMTCEPDEAARRILLSHGQPQPSDQQIKDQSQMVVERRERDRNRADRPFLRPDESIHFTPENQGDILQQSYNDKFKEPPATIIFDNTHMSKPDMLGTVSNLAIAAVELAKTKV